MTQSGYVQCPYATRHAEVVHAEMPNHLESMGDDRYFCNVCDIEVTSGIKSVEGSQEEE